MKSITIVLGLVTVMAAMMVALAAPAMAKDNNRQENHVDNRLDRLENRLDNRFDLEGNFLVSDVDFSPVFTTDEGLADELCSPLSSDAINNAIPGCIFGDRNDDPNIRFVRDVDFDSNIDFDDVDFDGDIDDIELVDVDFDRDIRFANGNNHDGGTRHNGNSKNHNNEGGKKGDGK
jgi:hypothetical protein